MKALAIGIMMWMQANCNIPGVHPEQNFCNLDWNKPAPVITVLSHNELVRQFKINHGTVPNGNSRSIKGFYLKGTNKIYMKKQDYSRALSQSDILHELVHYIQNENGLLDDCDAHFEIPAYLMQIHYYREKTGRSATAGSIEHYKRKSCNTLY